MTLKNFCWSVSPDRMYPKISCKVSTDSRSCPHSCSRNPSHTGQLAVGSYSNGRLFSVKKPSVCGSSTESSRWKSPFFRLISFDASGLFVPNPSSHTGGCECALCGRCTVACNASIAALTSGGVGANGIRLPRRSVLLHLFKNVYILDLIVASSTGS